MSQTTAQKKIELRNIIHILQYIKDYKGFKTSTALAEYLGVSKSTLSNWIARGMLDERLIQSKMPEIRLEFLRTGEMPMTEQGDMIQFLLRKIEMLERKIEKLEKDGR
jgi:DNA-binding MarR family transcriptional regulator